MTERVRVKAMMPPGHVRTPTCLRGKTGEIERALGGFSNPEQLAYRQKPDTQQLFRIRFSMAENTIVRVHDSTAVVMPPA